MSSSLPLHQYSSLGSLLASFSEKFVPERVRTLFTLFIWGWRTFFRIDQKEKHLAQEFNSGEDGFWHARWIWDELFYPEISATFIGESSKETPGKRAAQLIHGATEFYLKIQNNQIPMEVISGHPQDMSRYRLLFSRLTFARVRSGGMDHVISDVPPSDYVVLCINGHFYKIVVISNGVARPAADIYQAVLNAIEITKHRESSILPPIGILTALQNKKTVQVWERFERENYAAVSLLNEGLFVISIDTDFKPNNLDEMLSGFNSHNLRSRDCRRALQIVVSGNGDFAAIVNPHAGIGGTLSARLVSELSKSCKSLQDLSSSNHERYEPEPLFFNLSTLEPRALEEFERVIRKRLYQKDQRTTFEITSLGKGTFDANRMRVDAAFHAALSLTWKRLRGFHPTIGNFINLRSLKHGDIWKYTSTTYEMDEFLNNPSFENYLQAEQAHIQLIKEQKLGQDEVYLGAMGLKRLVNEGTLPFSAFVTLMIILSLFIKDFNRRFINTNLWVSCIPSIPGVKAAGRGGSMMSYLEESSTGGHYMIFDDRIMVCLMNAQSGHWLGTESLFAEELERSLKFVSELKPAPQEVPAEEELSLALTPHIA